MRGARLGIAREHRPDVAPVDDPVRRRFGARERREGRQDVDRHGGRGGRPARRDPPGPAGDEGNAHAAVEYGPLPLAQGPRRSGVVAVGEPGPVVRGEQDHGAPVDPEPAQGLQHLPDGPVDLRDHVAVEP